MYLASVYNDALPLVLLDLSNRSVKTTLSRVG